MSGQILPARRRLIIRRDDAPTAQVKPFLGHLLTKTGNIMTTMKETCIVDDDPDLHSGGTCTDDAGLVLLCPSHL